MRMQNHIFKSLAILSLLWAILWIAVDYPLDVPRDSFGSYFNLISYPFILPYFFINSLMRPLLPTPPSPIVVWGIPAAIIFAIGSILDLALKSVLAGRTSSDQS